MGTRSLTIVQDHANRDIMVMYRQMDGYPEGMGMNLFEAFGDFQLCNGYNSEQQDGKWANGTECLAAQVVAKFKDEIGSIYLHPSGTRNIGEEFIYYLYADPHTDLIRMKVIDVGWGDTPDRILYDGAISGFKEWLDHRVSED